MWFQRQGASSCAGVLLTRSLCHSFDCSASKMQHENRLWLKGEEIFWFCVSVPAFVCGYHTRIGLQQCKGGCGNISIHWQQKQRGPRLGLQQQSRAVQETSAFINPCSLCGGFLHGTSLLSASLISWHYCTPSFSPKSVFLHITFMGVMT